MAYSYAEIRSFQGLFLQQNSFQVPDGAMEEAKNVVIKSDDVITKTNGFYTWWQATPLHISDYGVPKATVSFQGQIVMFSAEGVGHFGQTFPFGGTFNARGIYYENDAQATTYENVTTFEMNNNLYFNAQESVRKLETYAGAASRAGVPPALTLNIDRMEYIGGGVLKSTDAGTQIAYRVVFGRRDTNGNLLLSAPSDILVVGMPAKATSIAYSIVTVFGQNYVEFEYPTDPYLTAIYDNFLISDATNMAINGPQTYSPGGDPAKVSYETAQPTGSGTLSVYFPEGKATIKFEIPSELEGPEYEYFYQVYRSSPAPTVLDSPYPDFKLINEATLTEEDYLNRIIFFEDTIEEILKGAELYTNPNTREGPLEENSRPPLPKFVGQYKGYGMYANIQSVQRMALNLVNPEKLIGIDLIFKSGIDQEVYRAVNPDVYAPGNVNRESATVVSTNPLVLTIGGPFNPYTFPVGSKALITNIIGGTLVPGEYEMTAYNPSNGDATFGSAMGSATIVDFQFVSDGTARLYNGYESSYNNIGDVGDKTVSQWTAYVAQELARAININQDSFMYANYRSGFNEFPGSIGIQSKKFIEPIYLRYSVTPSAAPFIQNIPDSFVAGTQFYSDNDIKPHWVCPSKFYEPEAVPAIHFIPVGSSSSEIVGQDSTRDSWIVLKEDGAFRIRGDSYESMVVEPIDLTVKFIKGTRCVLGKINNTIIAFCNQGIVQITDTSLQLISRRIEDVIQPLIGRDLSKTYLAGHEADRLFFIATEAINPGQARKCWVYNVVNQTWTEIDKVFDHMALDPQNALMGLTADPAVDEYKLWKQRRTNTRVDWCGEWAFGPIITDTTVYPDKMKGEWTFVGGNEIVPEPGDVILASNIFNRIVAVTESLGVYTITFAQPVSYTKDVQVNVFLYKAYESTVKMAPFHAGMVGRMKHFAQMQIHMRQQVITDLTLDFSGGYFNGSNSSDWKAINIATIGANGWGFSPWGQFPWGLTDGSNLKPGTESASIIRTYVPRFAARNTFIQPRLRHKQAAQAMYVQAMSWSIHSFGERVSK